VFECWNHPACVLDLCDVDLGHDEAGRFARIGKNFSPGIDDQRVPVGLAPARMLAALGGREDVTPGLNRPGD